MIYICSDIHGEYDLFMRLLEKIRFSASDEMIICGDVIDKGVGSVHLLKLISTHKNFTFISGNHEYDFLKYYHALMRNEDSDYDKVLKKLQEYFPNDGNLLDWGMVDWLENQSLYLEREGYICVHAGIPVLSDNTLMHVGKATAEQLVYDRRFKDPRVLPKTDKCVFFGHTPALYLNGTYRIITYPKVNNLCKITDYTKIHLDIGSYLGGGVGCFCIDTLTEHYIKV